MSAEPTTDIDQGIKRAEDAQRAEEESRLNSSAPTRQSMVEERESTPEGRREMAAARATVRTISLLHEAFERSGLTREELATRLGVSVERVDEILDGDGNLRITTVARVASILGYRLDFVALPEDDDSQKEATASPKGRRARRRD